MLCKVLNGVGRSILDSEDSLYVLNETADGWLNPDALEGPASGRIRHQPGQACSWGSRAGTISSSASSSRGCGPSPSPDDDKRDRERLRIRALRDPGPGKGARHLLAQGTTVFPTPHAERALRGPIRRGARSTRRSSAPKQYHRWHSPVTGIIRKMEMVPGTYYAEAASEGFDPAGPNDSQGYIAHVATRALIFIEADNPAIGLLCIVRSAWPRSPRACWCGQTARPLKEGQQGRRRATRSATSSSAARRTAWCLGPASSPNSR